MALTRITQGVIKPNQNYDTHNINSTGIVTATGLNISGNASIGGVLTYEDVTNVDSVGLLTARSGIRFGGHILPTVNETYDIGSADKKVRHLFLSDNSLKFVDSSDTEHPLSVDSGRLKFAGGMLLGNDIKLDPISGIITATSFVKGDGSPVGGVASDANDNTIAGTGAGSAFDGGAYNNTLFGKDAGNDISNGDYNNLFGVRAGEKITTGKKNTFIGSDAGRKNVGGSDNVCVGHAAGEDLGTGTFGSNISGCIMIGTEAGGSMQSGNYNVMIGHHAGVHMQSGRSNVCVGYLAGQGTYQNCTGQYNIAIGESNLYTVQSGSYNHVMGRYAGHSITTGNYNICIGDKAGAVNTYAGNSGDLTTGSNNIIIGSGAQASSATVSNEITLGDSNITNFRIPGLSITINSDGISDAKGNLRRIPVDTYNSSHTLGAQNAGETVYISSGGVTIPSGTFTAGDAITIINNSGSDQTITCSAVTTYLAGDTSSKSSLTLKGRGMATFYFASSSEVYGSGAGLE